MIACSEPLEFFPQGRQALHDHPGILVIKKQANLPAEHVLLNRMQNVNISSDSDSDIDYWLIRSNGGDRSDAGPHFLNESHTDTEEELYFKGNTAVWTQGIISNDQVLPQISLTCETPIKFALFCSDAFIRSAEQYDTVKQDRKAVFLIDETCLKVYCSNGETFVTSVEGQISKVWTTRDVILLEKEPSVSLFDSHTISMPRLFSLCNPLDEMCPVLLKTPAGINYVTEGEQKIVFADCETNLVLMFDTRISRHLVFMLRKANGEEIAAVAAFNETNMNSMNYTSQMHSTGNVSRGNLTKHSFIGRHGSLNLTKPTISVNATHSFHAEASNHHNYSSQRLQPTHHSSHLSLLQSSLRDATASVGGIRKMGMAGPPKPVVPDIVLELIWPDETICRTNNEIAKLGFLHTDLLAQKYLCLLLYQSCKLFLVALDDSSEIPRFGDISFITAKDAVPSKRLNMIIVLAPCGTLLLYSGPVTIGKLHIGGILSTLTNSTSLGASSFGQSSFPRRSSLLPTASTTNPDLHFEEELHSLSPVPHLQAYFSSSGLKNNCKSIRDAADNRVTLVYQDGRMFRIALPLLSETTVVGRCLLTLRQVLPKEVSIRLLVKWYSTRNTPGTQNMSPANEWTMFVNFMHEQIGRSMQTNSAGAKSSAADRGAEEPKKRRKSINSCGQSSDWNYVLNFRGLGPNLKAPVRQKVTYKTENTLFAHIPIIFYSLHLLHEEMKLDITLDQDMEMIATFLSSLASDFAMPHYQNYYFLHQPQLIYQHTEAIVIAEQDQQKLINRNFLLGEEVASIFQFVYRLIRGERSDVKFPYIGRVNEKSRALIEVVTAIFGVLHTTIFNIVPADSLLEVEGAETSAPSPDLLTMMTAKITRSEIERLPTALHFILAQALEKYRLDPPIGHHSNAYKLLLRPELVAHAKFLENSVISETAASVAGISQRLQARENALTPRIKLSPDVKAKSEKNVEDDGMQNMDTTYLRLRFPDDLRINEVRKFLKSSEPVTIDLTQSPTVSDHDFIEEQEKQLYALCARTMALPIGRGMFTMFTLRSSCPVPTEPLQIPKLCLTGKEPIRGATIELQQIEVPPNMNLWPLFHNGVAAGLRITPEAAGIDSTWIIYNKPKGPAEVPNEHAGFLMALGLSGHLKCLSFMSIYEYLVKCDEITSLGLLLGISATYRGTMDTKTTKLLSVHIEALLPPTAVELDVPQNIQVAALMGIGLVYMGTAKRHIAEILLQEIGRPPGPEMENYVERESYSLTAGLALGMVVLGQSEAPTGLKDLNLADTLHYYMVGGNKRPLAGSQKEKYKLPSFQIREGTTVNIDITAPGATLALGLIYFRTGNEAIANWMKPPDTKYLLNFLRPDLLLLRVLARGMIMWDTIQPTALWIYQEVPISLRKAIKTAMHTQQTDVNWVETLSSQDIDHESNFQAYYNIITGAALIMGLRYAGTGNQEAFKALKKHLETFLSGAVNEFSGKATVESCSVMILLALSLVFAGTGNLEIFRIIRMMRARIGQAHSHVTYGSHMAIHMALGFLFLGGGRYTISRKPEAIAALICALFPKLPNHSNDNRYHLQAFRHLYVLALEPRLVLPREIKSGKLCLCQISYVELTAPTQDMSDAPDQLISLMAPCMLPELDTIKAIYVDDPHYWPVKFEINRNWDQLLKILATGNCIDIKQRSGCLSFLDDPTQSKSLLAQTLTSEQFTSWKISTKNLLSFSNDKNIVNFTNKLLMGPSKVATDGLDYIDDNDIQQNLMLEAYNCLIHDKMHALPIYISLMTMLQRATTAPTVHDVWQFKIITAILDRYKQIEESEFLFSKELLLAKLLKFRTLMESMRMTNARLLKLYITPTNGNQLLSDCCLEALQKVVALVVYYDLPKASDPICGKLLTLRSKSMFEIMLAMGQTDVRIDVIYNYMKTLEIVQRTE